MSNQIQRKTVFCHRFDGCNIKQVHYKVLQTSSICALTMSKVDLLLHVTTAILALYTLILCMKDYWNMTYRDSLEVAPYITITNNMTTLTTWTAHFVHSLLDIQNYLAIFVAETVALESIDAECEKQEAGIYHVIYSLVATKI